MGSYCGKTPWWGLTASRFAQCRRGSEGSAVRSLHTDRPEFAHGSGRAGSEDGAAPGERPQAFRNVMTTVPQYPVQYPVAAEP